MEQSTKKKLIVFSSVLVIGGVIGYLLWRRNKLNKKLAELQTTNGDQNKIGEPVIGQAPPKKVADASRPANILEFQKFANKQGAGIVEDGKWGSQTQAAWDNYSNLYSTTTLAKIVPKQIRLISANELLRGNSTGANNKYMYAGYDGLKVLYDNGDFARMTKKDEMLGTVYKVSKANVGYLISFIGFGGVKYKIYSAGMNIAY